MLVGVDTALLKKSDKKQKDWNNYTKTVVLSRSLITKIDH